MDEILVVKMFERQKDREGIIGKIKVAFDYKRISIKQVIKIEIEVQEMSYDLFVLVGFQVNIVFW